MTNLAQFLADVWILIPVALLFVVGLGITVKSAGEGHVRIIQAVKTVTKSLVILGLCAALMIVVQSFAGFKMNIGW